MPSDWWAIYEFGLSYRDQEFKAGSIPDLAVCYIGKAGGWKKSSGDPVASDVVTRHKQYRQFLHAISGVMRAALDDGCLVWARYVKMQKFTKKSEKKDGRDPALFEEAYKAECDYAWNGKQQSKRPVFFKHLNKAFYGSAAHASGSKSTGKSGAGEAKDEDVSQMSESFTKVLDLSSDDVLNLSADETEEHLQLAAEAETNLAKQKALLLEHKQKLAIASGEKKSIKTKKKAADAAVGSVEDD